MDQGQQQRAQQNNRPPVNRKVVLRLRDPDAPGVEVVVTATDHDLPSYSVRIGKPMEGKDAEAPPLPFFGVRVDGQRTGGAQLDQSIDRLFVMLDKAREFIQTEAMKASLAYVDRRIERDERRANFGKQVTRKTGKTERDRAKKRGGA